MTDTRRLTIDIDVKSGELARVNNQLLETEKRGNAAAKSMTSLGVGYLAVSQGIRDVMSMARPVLDFFKENIRLANEQIKAETNLAAVMKSRGQFTEQNVKGVVEYATALQRQVGASDDATIAAAAQIGAMSKLSGESYPKAAQAAFQLSKMLKIDLDSAAKLVGKTLESKTNSMARYGIQIDKNGTQLEKLEQILKATEAGMAIARAEVNTLEGATGLLTASWNDYRETMGMYLSDNPFLVEALKGISAALDGQTDSMAQAQQEGGGYIMMLRAIGLAAVDAAGFVARLTATIEGAAAYANYLRVNVSAMGAGTALAFGPQLPGPAQAILGRVIGGSLETAENDLNAVAGRWGSTDAELKALRASILGMDYSSVAGGAGAAGIGAGSGGFGGGGAGKAKRGGGQRQSLMDIIEGRDMIENITGAANRLGGDFSFNSFLPMGAAGAAFGGITGAGTAQAVAARQRLLGSMGMGGMMGGGWGSPFNPFSFAAGAGRQHQRAGGVAGGAFSSITGAAGLLQPAQTPWYMTAGAERWGGVAGGLLGGGLQGGLSAAGGIFGSMLGPLGGLAGGWLGNKLGGLFGGGGKKRPDAGLTPAQPIYTAITNIEELKAMFLSVTQSFMLMGAGRGVDAATAGLQAAAGFKGTMPAVR